MYLAVHAVAVKKLQLHAVESMYVVVNTHRGYRRSMDLEIPS